MAIINEEKKKRAILMRKGGQTLESICEALDLNRSTLQRWCNAAGLTNQRHRYDVKMPKVGSRRQAKDSTHVMGRPQLASPEEVQAELNRLDGIVDQDTEIRIRDAAKTGDLRRAASVLHDGCPEEWRMLGELIAPDFLKKDQSGLLLFHLAAGVHRATALARCGIRPGDFEVWAARAANRKEPWSSYIELCAAAQSSACIHIQHQIAAKAPGWQALAWTLERLSPEIYARHVGTEDQVEDAAFADVGDDNLKRTALAYIVSDNDRKAADVEYIDLDEIGGRVDG